jgi:hypothetical protein
VIRLRHLGTARTGAYFGVAPFFGALLAITALGEPATPQLMIAGALMALGVWLHLTERHEHDHVHEALEHEHEHTHDEHHQHTHDELLQPLNTVTGTTTNRWCMGIPTFRTRITGTDTAAPKRNKEAGPP